MSNALYGKGKEKIGAGQINFLTDPISAYLVKSTYTPNLGTDEFVSNLGANVIAGPIALANKTFPLGVFDADQVTFTAVAAGNTASYVVLAKNTGVAGTSPLLVLYDTLTNFPMLTNGGDISVADNEGVYRWFSL